MGRESCKNESELLELVVGEFLLLRGFDKQLSVRPLLLIERINKLGEEERRT